MNTITLQQGFFSRRNTLDWVFAVLVLLAGLFALSRYAHAMDVYEQAILIGAVPCAVWIGWFWRPLRSLMMVVAAL